MIHRLYIFFVSIFFLVWGGTFVVSAQTIDDDWKGEIKNAIVIDEPTVYYITGNVVLTDSITVKNGGSLEIINNTDTDCKIESSASKRWSMFIVQGGAELIIKGNNGRIIIDGGSDFEMNKTIQNLNGIEYLTKLELVPQKENMAYYNAAIRTRGTLTLDKVTIQNVEGLDWKKLEAASERWDSYGGAIYVESANSKSNNACLGKTTLTDCVFDKCKAGAGSAIFARYSSNYLKGIDSDELCAITLTRCKITNCHTTGTEWNGGALRSHGDAVSDLNLIDCVFEGNYTRHGACVFWNAFGRPDTKLTIDGCTFRNNGASGSGGAMYVQSSVEFVNKSTVVEYNYAGNKGGGVHVGRYSGGFMEGDLVDMEYDFSDKLTIKDNYAKCGGGLSVSFDDSVDEMQDGSTVDFIFSGAILSDNYSSSHGGGMYFINERTKNIQPELRLYLNRGTIKGNEAGEDGGALYINNMNLNYIQNAGDEISITENKANSNGGAIYITEGNLGGSLTLGSSNIKSNKAEKNGGAFYLSSGTLTIAEETTISNNSAINGDGGAAWVNGTVDIQKNAIISKNSAGGNGGGFSVKDGDVKIASGKIENNTCYSNGGGLYVENTYDTDRTTVSFEGNGEFSQNKASGSGGGMYVTGNLDLTFAGNIIENQAGENGGGVYLTDGAGLTINRGLIKNNLALGIYGKDAPESASFLYTGEKHGIGGGIFVGNGHDSSNLTSLTFNIKNNIGVYGNDAVYGADDLAATGGYTSVTLPKVTNMNLMGFSAPTGELYWAEDFIANDKYYNSDLMGNADYESTGKNYRYDDAIKNAKAVYKLVFDENVKTYVNSYMCLEIGYELIFVELVKKGLELGENAVFMITPATEKVGENYKVFEGVKPYIVVMFKCINEDQIKNGVKRVIVLPGGWWEFKETSWSWAYEEIEPVIRQISTDENREIEFTNTRKTELPLNSEAIITNKMK